MSAQETGRADADLVDPAPILSESRWLGVQVGDVEEMLGPSLALVGRLVDRIAIWSALVDAERALKALIGQLEEECAREIGYGATVSVDGVGPVSAVRTSSRKEWDHEGLIGELVGRLAAEHGGVVTSDGEEVDASGAVASALHHAFAAFQPSWRIGDGDKGTGLKGLGIDPEEYCVRGGGRWVLRR